MLVLIIEVFVCIFKVKLVLRKIKEREKKRMRVIIYGNFEN